MIGNGWWPDGGGYAMGTVCGPRTRRYHGLLVPAVGGPSSRRLKPGRAGSGAGAALGRLGTACRRTGLPADGVLDGLAAHLAEWGLGSVSETADGDPPHAATGCPFQAWPVAPPTRPTPPRLSRDPHLQNQEIGRQAFTPSLRPIPNA